MPTLVVKGLSIHYLISIWATCGWNLNKIIWFNYNKILSFLTKMVHHFWQSIDTILKDIAVTNTIVWCFNCLFFCFVLFCFVFVFVFVCWQWPIYQLVNQNIHLMKTNKSCCYGNQCTQLCKITFFTYMAMFSINPCLKVFLFLINFLLNPLLPNLWKDLVIHCIPIHEKIWSFDWGEKIPRSSQKQLQLPSVPQSQMHSCFFAQNIIIFIQTEKKLPHHGSIVQIETWFWCVVFTEIYWWVCNLSHSTLRQHEFHSKSLYYD